MKKYSHVIFYILIFLFVLSLCCVCPNVDPDLFARLLQGNAVLNTGSVLYSDPYSYINTHAWIDHEWGSGVIFSAILNTFGYVGLKIFKALLFFGMLICIFNIIRIRGITSTKLYNILFFLLIIKSFETILITGIRCQCFSFFLFALFLNILEEVRANNRTNLLFFLPVIMIFWANVHGGCVAGLGLIVIYIIGELLNKKSIKKYLITLFISCFALLINPYGIEYIKFLLSATTMQRPMIAEWQNIFEIQYNLLWKSKIFALFAIITFIFSLFKTLKDKQNIDFTKNLLIIVMCVLGLSHIKHLPFFIITLTAFLYDDFFILFNGLVAKIRKFLHINSEIFVKKFVYTKELLVCIYILICSFGIVYTCNSKIHDFVLSKYPAKIVEFMKINSLNGNILNNFGIGSYLAYKLYPNNLIYMDGRYEEVYYDETTMNNWNFYYARKNMLDVFIKDGFPDYIIVHKDDLIYNKMKNIMNFKQVFQDNNFFLYIRNDLLKGEYKQPNNDKNYYRKTFLDINT